MLQPASITSLLNQLIRDDPSDPSSIRPHTAILTLLESSELYAVATRLVESQPSSAKSTSATNTVASILASTAAAAGTAAPASSNGNHKPAALSLDERATCLSAIAVTSWRQSTESSGTSSLSEVAMPGSSVKVSKHAITGIKGDSQELVPLLFECDLGRVLVMPIVPAPPQLSQSRSELAAMDDAQDVTTGYMEGQQPFMLLTLNAALAESNSSSPPRSPTRATSTPNLSATIPGKARFKSGGTTPTSTRSGENTDRTPSRSPVSEHFPTTATLGPPDAEQGAATPAGSGKAEVEKDVRVWSELYAQAKALARVLAPSLTRCGVARGDHVDDHVAGGAEQSRGSGVVSDDDAEG